MQEFGQGTVCHGRRGRMFGVIAGGVLVLILALSFFLWQSRRTPPTSSALSVVMAAPKTVDEPIRSEVRGVDGADVASLRPDASTSLAGVPSTAVAGGDIPLGIPFQSGNDPVQGLDPAIVRDLQGVTRMRQIAVSPEIAGGRIFNQGERIEFELFDGNKLVGIVDFSNRNCNDTTAVAGKIEGQEHSSFAIACTDGRVSVEIALPAIGVEHSVYARDDRYYAFDYDPTKRGQLEGGPSGIALPDPQAIAAAAAKAAAGGTINPDVTSVIDIMVVYTPAAKTYADSNYTSIANAISLMMTKGQTSFTNSSIDITWNLIHSAQVTYTESGDSETDLDRLTFHAGYDPWGYEGTPRYMDEIHTWRTTYGADIVSFLTKVEDVGGLGWLLESTSGEKEFAFHITRIQQATSTYTDVHEAGHNMGAHHAKDQNFQPGPTGGSIGTDAAGWHWHPTPGAAGYCSVMTYESGGYFADGLGHSRVGLFSDPNLTDHGMAAGHVTNANNARVLRAIKGVIAAYYARPGVGSLTVTISPAGAVSAGAQWRLTSGSDTGWKNSGTTLANIGVNNYTLEFKDVTGWTTPVDQSVTINANQTTNTSGTYTIKSYTVTFQTDGTAGTSLTGSVSQVINHGGTCTAVTANAPVGYELENWTGSGFTTSTSNPLTVTNVTQNLAITANFAVATFTVRFQAGAGGRIASGATQIVEYDQDANPVTAVPSTGYHFVKWTHDGSDYSTDNPLSITGVIEDLTYVANFALNEYTMTFIADPVSGGMVNGAAVVTETVLHGSNSIEVTAAAAANHLFTGWVGDGGFGMTNPVQFTSVTGARTVTATFLDTTGLDCLACGSALSVDESELAAAIDQFTKKPKLYTVYYDPVKDLRLLKPKKAGVKVLSKVSVKAPLTAVDGEWTKKIRLYDVKAFMAERKLGTDAVTWLGAHRIDPMPMPLRIKSKEAGGVILDEDIRTVLLGSPEIGDVVVGDAAGVTTLTLTGKYFGVKAPKVWLEYDDPGGKTPLKTLKLKALKPTGEYLDNKGKPACMDPENGDSKVVVVLPAKLPKGVNAWTDITVLVLENGVGMDAWTVIWP